MPKREWFENYLDKQAKIEDLTEKKKKLPKTVDMVKGSQKGFPYLKRSIEIYGTDWESGKKIEKEIAKLRTQCESVEAYIDGIESEKTQNVMRWRFLEGMSWKEIGRRIDKSESAAQKRAERALKAIKV